MTLINQMKKKAAHINIRHIFIFLIIISFGINAVMSLKEMNRQWNKNQNLPFHHHGRYVQALKPHLIGINKVSYFTDRNLNDSKQIARFFQIQNTLAPIFLDQKNPNHQYMILDFTNQKEAFQTFNQLKPIPVIVTDEGIMLAKRKY